VPLSDEVHQRTLTMKYADAIVQQHERFFLGRVEQAQRGLGEVRPCTPRTGSPRGTGGHWRKWTPPPK
jgi:hypothetical protein